MGVEVERRFLVRNIDWPALRHAYDVRSTRIEQVYLSALDGWAERVRHEQPDAGEGVRTHTRKRVMAPGTREEQERIVEGPEFDALLDRRDGEFAPIVKVRHRFAHRGRVWELDEIQSPRALTILEVELDSLDEEIELPTGMTIEREVTHSPEYSNQAIARRTHSDPPNPIC